MKVDLTLLVTPALVKDAQNNEKKAFTGHLGTHFDVMNKTFPLDYTERKGIVFDVNHIKDRDIEISDIALEQAEKDMFVAFHTGFIEETGYGTNTYFKEHPQLSDDLIKALVEKKVSIIGVDCAGVRRGKEHVVADQYCADHGVFVVENLCNFKTLLQHGQTFMAHTYPMHFAEMTGLPCRVVADI